MTISSDTSHKDIQQQCTSNEHTIDDTNGNFDIDDIRPTCIKILNAEDFDKSLISYDAEVYEGGYDSNMIGCSKIPQHPQVFINMSKISTSINLHQQQHPSHNVYSLQNLTSHLNPIPLYKCELIWKNNRWIVVPIEM